MDDAPNTDDLDLGAVSTPGELAALLRTVRRRADNPSLRTLEARTRHRDPPLSKTTAASMLKGARFPRKAAMLAFLRACGIPDDKMGPWQRTWEQVASRQEGPSRPGATQASGGRREQGAAGQQLRRVAADTESEMQARRADQATGGNRASTHPAGGQEVRDPLPHRSMWHFRDSAQIMLVSCRLPPEQRPPSSDPSNQNYVRFADLADLDTLIDIYGAVRANNPESQVVIRAAQDLGHQDLAAHLVLIGGLTWQEVTPLFSHGFSIPIEAEDPFERGAIMVHDPETGEREFGYSLIGNEVTEDVGFFVCGKNPSAPRSTLIICGGVTTRGVRGAALCFIDREMRDLNEQYVLPRFPDGSTYCIVMKVAIFNRDPLTPDLSKEENRLFEWCDVGIKGK